MRRWLRWLLLATVLSSGLALWWPEPRSQSRASDGSLATGLADDQIGSTSKRASTASAAGALPTQLPTNTLEPSRFDPFVGAQLPPPPPPPVVQAPPPPPPSPPPFTHRYLGRMFDPTGQELVYLSIDKRAVQVTVGTRLENGYVVENIGLEAISFHYPLLDTRFVMNIPAAQIVSPAR